ncbi:MAG: response regulator [Anaerolineae bacterium]|nr:response regulator [Anaerolineae bacterium]
MKQHEGHIDVQTEMGVGTTFSLYWPALWVESSQREDETLSDLVHGQGETILVVEDDAIIRAALVDVLEMLGYQTVTATHGLEALEICEQYIERVDRRISLVITDWVMPKMGGLELIHELAHRYTALKVVLLTGYPLTPESKATVPQNVVGWIFKPLRLEQLTEVIGRALKGENR